VFFLKLLKILLNIIESIVFFLPCPKNLNYLWNFGSFLGFVLRFQVVRGVFLVFFFRNRFPFTSIEWFIRLCENGFLIRCFHINLASLFFFLVYFHMFRGLYFFSFRNSNPWNRGVSILLILIIIAFLGYVLPWGQISFWAATVITKFFTVLPFIGVDLVQVIWRGFSVNNLTMKFFFCFHFLFPLILFLLVVIHLISVHFFGSSNPSSLNLIETKLIFSPFFVFKDLLNLFVLCFILFYFSLWISSESVNFIPADRSSSPAHIKPEWYFLFAYAILRSVPNKLLGVILIGFSLILFYFISFQKNYFLNMFKFLNLTWFFFFFFNFVFLRWVGGNPVTDLFVFFGFFSSIIYFILFFILFLIKNFLRKNF
jgi:ubiquinol-cytochrome c reductase cytochrome b subunit